MSDQQPEARMERQQAAQVAGGAGAAAAAPAPVPLAADAAVQQLVGDRRLVAELLARVADEAAAEALQVAVGDGIAAVLVGLGKGVGQRDRKSDGAGKGVSVRVCVGG